MFTFAQRSGCKTESVAGSASRARPTLLSEFRILPAQLNLNLPYHLEQEPRTLLPTEPPEDAPEPLKAAWPQVRMWAGSDATARGAFVDSASNEELEKIMGTVDRLFPVILSYLEKTGDADRALPYVDLAQAALEARFELESRRI